MRGIIRIKIRGRIYCPISHTLGHIPILDVLIESTLTMIMKPIFISPLVCFYLFFHHIQVWVTCWIGWLEAHSRVPSSWSDSTYKLLGSLFGSLFFFQCWHLTCWPCIHIGHRSWLKPCKYSNCTCWLHLYKYSAEVNHLKLERMVKTSNYDLLRFSI